jgi:hypothetical protein
MRYLLLASLAFLCLAQNRTPYGPGFVEASKLARAAADPAAAKLLVEIADARRLRAELLLAPHAGDAEKTASGRPRNGRLLCRRRGVRTAL